MANDPYSRLKRFASGIGQVIECVGYVVLKKTAYADSACLSHEDLVEVRGRVNLERTVKIFEIQAGSSVDRLFAHRDSYPNEDTIGYLLIGEDRLPKDPSLHDAKTRSNGEIERIFRFREIDQAKEYGLESPYLLFLR